MRFLLIIPFLFLTFFAPILFAVVNGTSVTVSGTTTCNNGAVERTVAGTMTTTCGDGWSVGALSPVVPGSLIFEENFDSQADWDSDILVTATKYDVPTGWTVGRSDPLWSPAGADPTVGKHPTAEILAANSSMAFGGTGKSYVMWRDSYYPGFVKFNSDALIMKTIPDSSEVYMELMITFSDETIATFYNNGLGQSKVMRTLYIDPDSIQGDPNNYFAFFGDVNSPKALYDFSGSTTSSMRNFLGIYVRGDNDIVATVTGIPSGFQMQGGGDLSLSYSQNGTSGAQLTDYLNGGIINTVPTMMDQVFGNETQWVKVAMYVKINSAPGVTDGVLKQWIDGVQITNLGGIPWIRAGQDYKLFNTVGIGGNDAFNYYANELKHQEWYAIDNFKVYNGLPEELQ